MSILGELPRDFDEKYLDVRITWYIDRSSFSIRWLAATCGSLYLCGLLIALIVIRIVRFITCEACHWTELAMANQFQSEEEEESPQSICVQQRYLPTCWSWDDFSVNHVNPLSTHIQLYVRGSASKWLIRRWMDGENSLYNITQHGRLVLM